MMQASYDIRGSTMKIQQKTGRIAIAAVIALCAALLTTQTASAGPSSPGPKSASTTLSTSTR